MDSPYLDSLTAMASYSRPAYGVGKASMPNDDFERLVDGFSRAIEQGPDESLRRYVEEGVGRISSQAQLLAWDANSIHSFVFDTPNATAIRGASRILEGIDAKLSKGQAIGLHPSQILFAGGGSGLAVATQSQARDAIEGIHRLYASDTGIATCSAALVPLFRGRETFSERVDAAHRALTKDRIERGPDAEPDVPFFAARCRVCGRRAAAEMVPRGGTGDPRPECGPCRRRIEVGKISRESEKEHSDFSHLADRAGYALIYLDGNGIGRAISELKAPHRYYGFSKALLEMVRDVFEKTAADFELRSEDDQDESKSRYHLPICGGDDLVAVVPARVSVPLARTLLSRLQEHADDSAQLKESSFGAAAGVAIGHSRFPIRHLLVEAQALLKSAKKRVYRDKARSALSFAVIDDGSPRAESMDAERWREDRPKLLLSGRPYTLDQMMEYSRRLEVLKEAKLGRSQLFALQRKARAGKAQLRNHILFQVGRQEGWRTLIRDLAKEGERAWMDEECSLRQFLIRDRDRLQKRDLEIFDLPDILELMNRWRDIPPQQGEDR